MTPGLINYDQGFSFLLLLVRVSGIIFMLPLYGDVRVPPLVKILFSLIISWFFYNKAQIHPVDVSSLALGEMVLFIMKELILAVTIGFLFRMVFFVVIASAEAISQTSGFSGSRLFNPHFDTSETVIAELFSLLVVLLFFSVRGETLVLRVLDTLFHFVPLGHAQFNDDLVRAIIGSGTQVLQMGLRLAGPLLFSLMFINLGMGVAGRIVPALNVMALSFTITLAACLWLIWLFLPAYVNVLESVFSSTEQWLLDAVGRMSGGP